jgi:o-succinylbenzoate---CoA ligase
MKDVISDWLLHRSHTHADQPAVITDAATLSYEELARRASGLVEALKARGLSHGDRVGLLAGNTIEFVVAVHAVPMAGGVLVPLNSRLTTEDLGWQLRNVGASMLLCDGEMGPRAGDTSAAAGVGPPLLVRDAVGAPQTGISHRPDEIHSIIHTSGTTGQPKGAMLTFGNFQASAAGSADNLGVSANDRWIACMPLFHVGGLSILLRSAIYGTTVVLQPSFDAMHVNDALRKEGATLLSVVATMLRRMLDADNESYPPTVRAVLVGGGPVAEDVLRRALARGLPVVQTYGLAEATSQVATLAPVDALTHLGSAGRPLGSTSVRIESEHGEPGEILVRGPIVFPGYYGDPAASDRALRDGWLRTGDIGQMDGEGYLTVLDRRDDLIVSGGENIYPAEVEAIIESHASVTEAAVIGEANDEWGQQAVAVVVPGAGFEPDELLPWLKGRLAPFKIPQRIQVVDALPRTASGKLQRGQVRELLSGAKKQAR